MSSVANSMSRLSLVRNNPFSYMDEARVENLLKCSWCHFPFIEPMSNGVDKTFCRKCLADYARHLGSNRTVETDQILNRIRSYKPVTEPLILAMLDRIPVRCLKCAEIDIPRGQLKQHDEHVCLKANVLCTAADIKCQWVGPRENLTEHQSTCQFEPLRPIFEHLFTEQAELRLRIQQLENGSSQNANKQDQD